jgi:pimeloyl-ACP methyl ester carboxylesterase
MAIVKVDDFDMYYEIHGEGESVLLIHGWGASHDFWRPHVLELAKSFKVITCDLRGHGESDKADPSSYSIKLFANDLQMFLDKLGVDKLHLVGHSLGGMLAEELVIASSARFDKLVICDSPSRSPFSRLELLMIRLVNPSKSMMRRSVVSQGLFYQPNEKNLGELYNMISKTGKRAFYNTARALMGYRTPKELASISLPMLLAYGEKSRFLKDGVEIHKMVLGSKFVVVPRAAHAMPMEQPEIFTKLVFDFCGTARKDTFVEPATGTLVPTSMN